MYGSNFGTGIDRSNTRLNEEIESIIRQWDSTVYGVQIKRMWENGTDYETMCENCNLDYAEYEED